jgi:pimeloyl-ACP methyl ester carboxylesterase
LNSPDLPRRRVLGRVPGDDWPPHQWHAEHLTIDGIRWFARISPAGASDPSQPPVVLLHGLVVSGAYFQPVATRLAASLAVFVPDVPGFGRSANPRGRLGRPGVWDMNATAAGLARWLDAHALRGCVLVANSLGCQIATLLACSRPELVARLVLVAPTMDPAARSIPAQFWRGLRDIRHESPALWSIWIPDALRAGPWRGLRTLHHGLTDDVAARLPAVSQPTLVVGGEDDPIVPPAWVETVAALLPNGRAIVIPGAPHAINYSAPGDLARIIRVFVASGEG